MSDYWCWSNAVDGVGAIVSSDTGSAVDLATTNVRDPRLGKIWRAGEMPAQLHVQLAATGTVAVFGLFGCNFRSVGSVTLRLGTFEGGADLWETTFSAAEVGARQAVFVLRDFNGDLSPVEAAHATILAQAGDPLEIGRVWIGGVDWHTSVGHSVNGSGWQGQDLSRRSQTPRSGAFLIDRGARLRSFTAAYDMLTPDEYAGTLFEMDERGLAQQMLFIPNPDVYDPHRFSVLGYLADMPATNWRALLTAGRTITIQEAG